MTGTVQVWGMGEVASVLFVILLAVVLGLFGLNQLLELLDRRPRTT
jgi:hypothetical protein